MSSVGRGRDVLFSQIATVNEVINLSEMQKFLLDFDVVPLIISKKEFQDVFVICMRLSDKAAMNALAKHAEDKKEKEDKEKADLLQYMREHGRPGVQHMANAARISETELLCRIMDIPLLVKAPPGLTNM